MPPKDLETSTASMRGMAAHGGRQRQGPAAAGQPGGPAAVLSLVPLREVDLERSRAGLAGLSRLHADRRIASGEIIEETAWQVRKRVHALLYVIRSDDRKGDRNIRWLSLALQNLDRQ